MEENSKYNNEYVKEQFFNIYGKPKGLSREQFEPELMEIIETMEKQSLEHDKFKKEYKLKHQFCPKCGHSSCTTTLVAYVLYLDKKEDYKDLNRCECLNCGDRHSAHDRIEKFDK